MDSKRAKDSAIPMKITTFPKRLPKSKRLIWRVMALRILRGTGITNIKVTINSNMRKNQTEVQMRDAMVVLDFQG